MSKYIYIFNVKKYSSNYIMMSFQYSNDVHIASHDYQKRETTGYL